VLAVITIREVLQTAHLGLHLVAGGAGLDRSVSWGHVCELEDPTPWLEGQELILTNGLAVPVDAQRQVAYVARLDEHGVSGLVVAYGVATPPLSSEMLLEAQERAFPILEAPLEVPFVAVSKMVADANQSEAQRRLLTHLRIFDALRANAAEGSDMGNLLARLEAITGFQLFLTSPTGTPLLPGLAPIPVELLAEFPWEADRPPKVAGGHIVPIPPAGRTGYLTALERPGEVSPGLTAAQHIATVVALELAGFRRDLEVTRRLGAEILSELLSEDLEPDRAMARLRALGFSGDESVVLLVMRTPPGLDTAVFHQVWTELDLPHLLLAQHQLFALVVADEKAFRIIEELQDIRVGASSVLSLRGPFTQARQEALWSLDRAVDAGVPLMRFPEVEQHLAWLPSDSRTLRHMAQHCLGPLIEYDARKGTQLLRTLQVWLDHNRSVTLAARTLYVHKHTLEYRLKRVEHLTQRDLSKVADQVDLWLALRALEVSLRVPPRAGETATA
jgi:purine catabolism regulator